MTSRLICFASVNKSVWDEKCIQIEGEQGITFKLGLSKHKSFGILLSQDDSLAILKTVVEFSSLTFNKFTVYYSKHKDFSYFSFGVKVWFEGWAKYDILWREKLWSHLILLPSINFLNKNQKKYNSKRKGKERKREP